RRTAGPSAVLRSLEREAEPREILIRIANHRIVAAGVDANRPVLVLAHAAHVQLERLPGPPSFRDLLRKHVRIAGGAIRILRDESGRLMIAVAVARVALKSRDEH